MSKIGTGEGAGLGRIYKTGKWHEYAGTLAKLDRMGAGI